MPTSVHIQYRFSTGLLPITVLIILLIAIPIIYMTFRKKEKKSVQEPIMNTAQNIRKPESVHSLYIEKARVVEKKVINDEISSKQGFQELSTIIRQYAKERTGIDVTNMTLAEIRGLNLPMLENVIESYYEYEFSDRYDVKDMSDNRDTASIGKSNINKAVSMTVFALENWK